MRHNATRISIIIRATLSLLSLPWIAVICPTTAAAATGAISQSYTTTTSDVGKGALVSLTSSKSSEVQPADTSTASNLVGISAISSAIELSSGASHSIQVVTNGVTEALVSDANGPVKAGDKIAASPVAAIGMKALVSGDVIGTAQENLSAIATVTEHVTRLNGQNVTLHVGLLPVEVNVAYYSGSPGSLASVIPPVLQNLADTIAGKQVSPLRALIGATALLFGFILITVMLYISIKSGIISIGRNPLAETALRRGLVDVIVAALGILVMTVVFSYAVLLV